jgi:hypothetical protein
MQFMIEGGEGAVSFVEYVVCGRAILFEGQRAIWLWYDSAVDGGMCAFCGTIVLSSTWCVGHGWMIL